MIRLRLALAVLFACLVLTSAVVLGRAGPPVRSENGGLSAGPVDRAIRNVYPALVRIHVLFGDFEDGREVRRQATGSGVIISPQGHVLTNHHVIARARRIRCMLTDKHEVRATLVGTDPLSDIAVLKIEDGARCGPFPQAHFGDSAALRVGDPVLALGCPNALSQSVTLGIVSNPEMILPGNVRFQLDGEVIGYLVKWIGHDARIYPGNSGGPLVDLNGRIVGINEIALGLSGAIPGNLAREMAQELIRHGKVRRSWLGLELQPLLRTSKRERGALVSSIAPGSPADRAGLRAGDVLLSWQGQAVSARRQEQMPDLHRLILSTPIGAEVRLTYERGGKEVATTARTVARGNAWGREVVLRSWGVTVRELSLLEARRLGRAPNSGALVTGVAEVGAAIDARPALRRGDVVVSVAGTPVRSLADLSSRPQPAAGSSLLVGIERGDQRLLTVLRFGGDHSGRVLEPARARLPVEVQPLTPELAKALGLRERTGARVTHAIPGSGPAVGDVIVRVNGSEVEGGRGADDAGLADLLRGHRVGARVRLEVVRQGQSRELVVALVAAPRPPDQLPSYRDANLEFVARDLAGADLARLRLSADTRGALVSRVERGGWAALGDFRADDVVLAVDGQPVRSLADFRARMRQAARSRPERLVFFVRRGERTLYLELEPEWSAVG